ncbi:MAG: cell division protein DedD [Betaproteobacteria bacterium ADurb.Bin341]|nr:MAG: cell division protein DedD [Betaproteobacteria bacterium ADurb.Bin341]
MEDKDALLHLKKRARRRLVGAVALAATATFVLNMAMDHQPKQEAQDVEIRIPGQDEKPFAPGFAAAPAVQGAPAPVSEPAPAKPLPTATKPQAVVSTPPVQAPAKKTPEVAAAGKPVAKPADKIPPAPVKPSEKPVAKPQENDAARAAAILAGKSPEPANHGTQYVILIGAFADPANVKNLQTKLSQLGIKVYTEPLDSPQGKKTRVRAGPFPTREAGEKALEKMKRIGVNGVLTAKQ